MNSRTKLDTVDIVQKLLTFISPLIECASAEEDAKEDPYEFEEIQCNTAKIAHIVACADSQQQFEALSRLKEAFAKGKDARMKFTFPAVVWAFYRLAASLDSSGESDPSVSVFQFKIFETAYHTIESVMQGNPDLALKLLLNGVLTLSANGSGESCEKAAAQYMNQALALYLELADSDMKYRAITLIVGTLEKATVFSKENFSSFAKRATQLSVRLLKKQDQCKAILLCSHMFNAESHVFFQAF